MSTQIVYSKEFNNHDDTSHPENARRLTLLYQALENSPLHKDIGYIQPSLLDEELLYEIHSPEMIERIKTISDEGDAWLDLDTYVCKNDYYTARLAAGGIVKLTHNILAGKATNGYALIRPPGHHATKNRSMGFCLFNNAALAAHAATKKGKHVLIFDPDVHHGNGTQDIFYNRSDILYQSLHLYPHFPGTGDFTETGTEDGKGYTINAPLPYGTGDQTVLHLMKTIFLPIAQQFKPDLIIISTGYDGHHTDRLGGLRYTANLYGKLIQHLQTIQPKILCTLEGGYSLNWIDKCFLSEISQLLEKPKTFEYTASETPRNTAIARKLKQHIHQYWDI